MNHRRKRPHDFEELAVRLTQAELVRKYHTGAKQIRRWRKEAGIPIAGKGVKCPVVKMDLNGEIICEYPSASAAARDIIGGTTGNILRAARITGAIAYGYLWALKDQGEE